MAKAVKKAAPKKAIVKKATPKKAAPKKEPTIKYTDKSAGQPELIPIFEAIKKMMMPYQRGSLKMIGGKGGMLCLISQEPVIIDGKKREELWFAGLLVQKGYVGFYYMPVYTSPEIKQVFKPELLKLLKGKSCFHIKKNDPVIMEQIRESLQLGYMLYKERGWL
jgi:hypothetical protein